MLIRQQRWRMLPTVLVSVAFLAPGLIAMVALIAGGMDAPIQLWTILAIYNGGVGYISLSILDRVVRPASIEVGRQGFSFDRAGKARAWDWSSVSNFRVGRHANGVYFDTPEEDGRVRVQALPGFWPGGPSQLVAWLDAARVQYTEPSSGGEEWSSARPHRGHPIRTFAITFVSVLALLLLWVEIVMTIHHHPWPLPLRGMG